MANFDEASSAHFWIHNLGYGWATLIALLAILFFHSAKTFFFSLSFSSSKRHLLPVSPVASASCLSVSPSGNLQLFRISDLVSEADLKILIENLDDGLPENEKWENVIDKSKKLLSYSAKCCKPKDAPLKYLSVTVFENCSPEILRDFYMDNDYRKQWDKTLIEHKQLEVDKTNGIEVGCTIKKFPLLTPREYILAWKLWEGKDKTFYCFIKDLSGQTMEQTLELVKSSDTHNSI